MYEKSGFQGSRVRALLGLFHGVLSTGYFGRHGGREGGPPPSKWGVQYFVTLSNFTKFGVLRVRIFREDAALKIGVSPEPTGQGAPRPKSRYAFAGAPFVALARSAPLVPLRSLRSTRSSARSGHELRNHKSSA